MSGAEINHEVQDLVGRILKDTSAIQDKRLRLINVPDDTRRDLIEVLSARETPVLSTGDACGPG